MKMFKLKKLWALLILMVMMLPLVVACSAPKTILKEVDEDTDRTEFLLNYELKGTSDGKEPSECSISLQQTNSANIYEIGLNPQKTALEFEVPVEGEYKIRSLSCAGGGKWDLNSFGAPSVTAFPGKVNFLGHFTFELSYKNGTHELSMNKGNREETRMALLSVARSKSSRWKDRLVSAYSGKGLDQKYLEGEENYKRGSVSHVVGKKVHLNSMNFLGCEKAEFDSNPVPLGILTYKLSYENSKLVEIQKVAEHHTFSPKYVSCVEEMMKNFDPGFSGKLTYDVNF